MRHRNISTLRNLLLALLICAIVPLAGAGVTERVLYKFRGGGNGWLPFGLTLGPNGAAFGATEHGGSQGSGTLFEAVRDSNGGITQSVIWSFYPAGGDLPGGAPIFDAAGNLYGNALNGGNLQVNPGGAGAVYKLSLLNGAWTESVVYEFLSGSDGLYPTGSLIADAHGNLYGVTQAGGSGNFGTIFELSRNGNQGWTKTTLYSFAGPPNDGWTPVNALVFDKSGNLYGTTEFGGPAANCSGGCGTAFELSPSGNGQWTENVLHTFGDAPDGSQPQASLVLGAGGTLYGTTEYGGAFNFGTVFSLANSSGQWNETVVHNFAGGADGKTGEYLTMDSSGDLFGTTGNGGNTACDGNGCGIVYRLHLSGNSWTENILYAFVGGATDGTNPDSLVFGPNNILLGTSAGGGNGSFHVDGVIFALGR